jgi:hypothetical protein
MKPKYCITCEANNVKPRKRARHFTNINGVELGFCNEHYDEYLVLEEFSIDLIEQHYGDNFTEN